MPLATGTRLGPYEIVAPLGAGGMGEVYRARDTKLNRDVAIKVLLASVANDPDRLARFSREAQVLAALNHPNIAHIHGLEDFANAPALVMELVEGPTLADRIAQGAIPVADALPIAKQIAEALEAAHEAGIIHRDLKPANIKVRDDGTVKVLDFGLAKALDPTSPSSLNATRSPTLSIHATHAGIILGTAAYMSPEQARGKSVDKRADIWAFGCVLYEMLTGQRAFPGDDVTDTIVAVVSKEPVWTALSDDASSIRPLLGRCLKKDARARLRDIGEARLQIEDVLSGSRDGTATTSTPAAPAAGEPQRTTRRRIAGAAVGVAIAVASVLATWGVIRLLPTPRPHPVHFAIVPPASQPLAISGPDRDVAISPDGTHVVYRAGGQQQLMVRAMDQLDAQPLAGPTAVRGPFISPDGHWVGFFTAGGLQKVLMTGGPPISLCQVTGGAPRGASWGSDDTIIFATSDPSTGLMQVPAVGGQPKALTKPDGARGEGDHLFPSFLPGSRAVLFTITSRDSAGNAQIAVLDLRTGKQKALVRGGSHGEYVAASASSGQAGYLVYAAAGTLRAVRFDPTRLEVLSDPVPVLEHVMTSGIGSANYAIARNGTLLYVPGGAGSGIVSRPVVWVDRQGHEEPVNVPARAYIAARLSPDGTRVAFDIRDQENDIWIWDFGRQTLTRLTFDPATDQYPVWSADGQRIIFSSSRAEGPNLYWQVADGTGTAERLTTNPNLQIANAISPDGTRIVLVEASPKTGLDLKLMSLAAPRRVEPLIATSFSEMNADISPDGRWIAYQSSESGQEQVFVRPFPNVDSGRWQVSTKGGSRPVWAKSGRELFYLEGSNAVVAVPVQTAGATFNPGNPTRLFEGHYFAGPAGRLYDVARDGQRFLMIKDNQAGDQTTTPTSMVVVLNWVEELRQRMLPR